MKHNYIKALEEKIARSQMNIDYYIPTKEWYKDYLDSLYDDDLKMSYDEWKNDVEINNLDNREYCRYVEENEKLISTLQETKNKLSIIDKFVQIFENPDIQTSNKSITTYLRFPKEELENVIYMLNKKGIRYDDDVYTKMENDEFKLLETIIIRVSDHPTGQYFEYDTFGGSLVSYDDESIKIDIRDIQKVLEVKNKSIKSIQEEKQMQIKKRIEHFQPVIQEWIEQDYMNEYINQGEYEYLQNKANEITRIMVEYFDEMEQKNNEVTLEQEMSKFNVTCKRMLKENNKTQSMLNEIKAKGTSSEKAVGAKPLDKNER